MDKIHITISPGEAFDRLSILQLKSEMIKNEIKQVDICFEMNQLKIILDNLLINFPNEYQRIYDINKKIWIYSDIIRSIDNKDEKYILTLINIHTENDNRFKIKSDINLLLNSSIKEHKGYEDIL